MNSRYYDPEVKRFINADDISYLGENQDLDSYNLYAYCGNNPVMGYDPMGTWNWGTFFSGVNLLVVGVTAIAVAATVLSCGAAAPLMVAVASVTVVAGAATAVNGVAEIVEAGTDYNFVRDGLMGGNEEAYETYKTTTQLVAEIGTMIVGGYYAKKGGNVCFVAGTLVLAEIGQVAIETIEAGDYVWATNTDTGETELKRVVRTFKNEATELVHITIDGETITCTNEHPFYSPVKGWTAACKLRAGDMLVTLNGEYVIVEWVQHEILESPVAVYNFEVEDFHTYYVGDSDGVLVHNSCNHKSAWNKERRNYWKNQSKVVELDVDYGSFVATDKNIARMATGKAPIGWDGYSVQLHHWEGIVNNFNNYSPVSRTLHQLIHKMLR